MKNMNGKKQFLLIILIFTLCLTAAGCGKGTAAPPVQASPTPSAEAASKISSIEIYNRTGKIQREDFYVYTDGQPSVSYTVEYSYTDSGRISDIRRNGGGLGENRPIESYFYSGDNCTQRIIYDSYGSTQTVYYWTYAKNTLTKERIVSMILAENGYTYSGKKEEVTEYNADGTAKTTRVSAPGDYSLDEYVYGENGLLLSDSYSHSSDGKTYRLFEVRGYFYDADGRLTRQTITDSLGNVTFAEKIEYSQSGDPLTDTTYSSGDMEEDQILVRKTYEYDDGGRLNAISVISGSEEIRTYYEYNSAGKTVRTTEIRYEDSKVLEKTVTEVEYDSRLNPVKETVRQTDGSVTVSYLCKYEYYDDGKIRSKTNYEV